LQSIVAAFARLFVVAKGQKKDDLFRQLAIISHFCGAHLIGTTKRSC
jgi:hypothetical protein